MEQDQICSVQSQYVTNWSKYNTLGVDGISTVALKACADSISRPVSVMNNLCFEQEIFPQHLKFKSNTDTI